MNFQVSRNSSKVVTVTHTHILRPFYQNDLSEPNEILQQIGGRLLKKKGSPHNQATDANI